MKTKILSVIMAMALLTGTAVMAQDVQPARHDVKKEAQAPQKKDVKKENQKKKESSPKKGKAQPSKGTGKHK